MKTPINPFAQLSPRLGLIVFGAIGALAVFMSAQFSERLTNAYQESARSQLAAIAGTWDDSFRRTDLDNPGALQRRIARMRANNPTLHKISVSWRDRRGATVLAQEGHEHDPDGADRDVSSALATRYADTSEPAPIDAGVYDYREVSAADGAYYAELNYPITRRGEVVAAMELHYDLEKLDAALAKDKRTLWVGAGLVALTLALLVHSIFQRAVLSPISKLREATRRLAGGKADTRLGWRRSDEIGALARDFDRMAEELESAQAHLQERALKDPLTDLLNHRAFQERMAQELRRAEREGYSVSVVALDVDYFKEINDRWGHAAGDDALRLLARAIETELRPSDICARVGGDEFMLAIVRSDVLEADGIVGRLRANVANLEVGPAKQTLTLSAGISEFPRHSLSQEDLMHLADGAMYWAKSSGRNRSCVYSSETDFALSAEEAADRAAREGLVNTVHALAKAVDAKDGYTHSHSQRVARYAATLAEHLEVDCAQVERIRTAGVLHDVGKIGISDILLLKPSNLTEEEFAIMRRHSELGRDIVAGAGMDDISRFVLHLHERYDGNGYPDGLAGEAIPLESRILHVADTLEAMTSSRVYRDALPLKVALAELDRHSGTQFDPTVTAAMLDVVRLGRLEIGAERETTVDPDLTVEVEGARLRLTELPRSFDETQRSGHPLPSRRPDAA